MHMEKELFGKQGLVMMCPHDHHPVMPQCASPPPRCLWVRSSPSLSPAGWGMGGEEEVVLFWENKTAGQEKPQPQHSHPLAFGHVSHFDGAHLVSHGRETGSCAG